VALPQTTCGATPGDGTRPAFGLKPALKLALNVALKLLRHMASLNIAIRSANLRASGMTEMSIITILCRDAPNPVLLADLRPNLGKIQFSLWRSNEQRIA